MTSPSELAAGVRAHAQGLYCGEAADELLIFPELEPIPGCGTVTLLVT